MSLPKFHLTRLALWCVFVLAAAAFAAPLAHAQKTQVIAIALFDGPSGSAYAQISGVTLNGKGEVRICDGIAKMSKSVYESLPKTPLAGAAWLERGNDGVLVLNQNSKPHCVVPSSNLKFDKGVELTPSDAADQAGLQGSFISSSLPGSDLPQLKRGVRLVFVDAPDNDLAQYLVAQRDNSIAGWKDFVVQHASSAHLADAKNALAALYQQAAEAAFAKYEKLPAEISALKQAQEETGKANEVVAGYPAASRLRARINKELDALLEPDRARLQAFRKALAEQAAGYAQLPAALKHTEELLSVNPEYAPVQNLHGEINEETRKLDSALAKAESLASGKEYDQALEALGPYNTFAGEAPRIAAIITAAYDFHFQRGRALAAMHDWEKAAAEFRRATEIKKDSPDAASELNESESQWAAARDRQAAEKALANSTMLQESGDVIGAYEVLDELPEKQRDLAAVSDRLAALQKNFVAEVSRHALKQQDLHTPVHGPVDAEALQDAYHLLSRASAATDNPDTKQHLESLSEKIGSSMGSYYVAQARKYLEKPMNSRVGIGWLYLLEAERYKPDLGDVKDLKAQYAPAYQFHSKLSIGVLLRDQTPLRESSVFGSQLEDAIASGLESSGLSVKVVRQPNDGAGAAQPNFTVTGEIRENRIVKDPNLNSLETLPSKYRAGMHEVPNEDWAKANEEYESAQRDLAAAQQPHGRKLLAGEDLVAAAQKRLDEAKRKLETTDKTRPEPVIATYNYTKKTIDFTPLVELAFHISDPEGNAIAPSMTVKKDNPQHFVVVENVKPEDTEGVKNQGTEPDEAQFLIGVELQARDELVKSVKEKTLALPAKVLQEARSRAQQNDPDGAAEKYIVYLNATPTTPSAEREEASKFLHDHYNVTLVAK